jgi:hypothetical protein
MRQVHAALNEKYKNDHIAANKKPPVPTLMDHPEYAAAKALADHAALPDKGERPDRDPQVGRVCAGGKGCTAAAGARAGKCGGTRLPAPAQRCPRLGWVLTRVTPAAHPPVLFCA